MKEKIAEKKAKVKMNNVKLQCKMSISSFVARVTGYEARVTGKSLKASLADRRVRQYCNKTSTAPPVSTTAENIGTVNVNDRNGVSNL